MGIELAELSETFVGQGYFLQNFLKKLAEDEFMFDEEFIGGTMIDLELITIPGRQYDDWRLNPTYDEMMTGYRS